MLVFSAEQKHLLDDAALDWSSERPKAWAPTEGRGSFPIIHSAPLLSRPAPVLSLQVRKARPMIDYGAGALGDEHGQLLTRDGEPIWVSQDGRHIALSKIDDEHLLAIRDMLNNNHARWGPWVEYVNREIERRAALFLEAS